MFENMNKLYYLVKTKHIYIYICIYIYIYIYVECILHSWLNLDPEHLREVSEAGPGPAAELLGTTAPVALGVDIMEVM